MSDEDAKSWIYAGALPYELTEGDIVCVFSQYGEICEISLSRDKDTGKSRGFCFIKYEDDKSCQLAVDNFHETTILGRKIKVSHANNVNALKSRRPANVAPQEGNAFIPKVLGVERQPPEERLLPDTKASEGGERLAIMDRPARESPRGHRSNYKPGRETNDDEANDDRRRRSPHRDSRRYHRRDDDSPLPPRRRRRSSSYSRSSSSSSPSPERRHRRRSPHRKSSRRHRDSRSRSRSPRSPRHHKRSRKYRDRSPSPRRRSPQSPRRERHRHRDRSGDRRRDDRDSRHGRRHSRDDPRRSSRR